MYKKIIVYLIALFLIVLSVYSIQQSVVPSVESSVPLVEYSENGGEWKAVSPGMIERTEMAEEYLGAIIVGNHSQVYFRGNKTLQLSFGIVEEVVPLYLEVDNVTVRVNKEGDYKVLVPCKDDITPASMVRFTQMSDYEMVPVHDYEREEEYRAKGMSIAEQNYFTHWIGPIGKVTEVVSRYEGNMSDVTKMKVSPDSNALIMSLDIASQDAPSTVEIYNLDISYEEEPTQHYVLGFETPYPGSYHEVYLPKNNVTDRPHIQVCLYRGESSKLIFAKNYTLVGNEYLEIS